LLSTLGQTLAETNAHDKDTFYSKTCEHSGWKFGI